MKKILLGVTGSVAAIKVPQICRLFREAGFKVKVVLSSQAQNFVAPLSLKALNNEDVYTDEDIVGKASLLHIQLARWADFFLIAPASAHTIAKFAHGFSDNLLSNIYLATRAKVIVAPAMNHQMWLHPAVSENCSILLSRGAIFLGPDTGSMASSLEEPGKGRLMEPENIVKYFVDLTQIPLSGEEVDFYKGRHVVITAGPTREPIDPVRFLSNRSSGKMGYALAKAARSVGARVTLISGPVALDPPAGVQVVRVQTSAEMLEASLKAASDADIFIGSSAVSDWRVANPADQKIKLEDDNLTLSLVSNVDIVASVAKTYPKVFVSAFAAETQDMISYAEEKLKSKGVRMMIANDVSRSDIGFDVDENEVTILSTDSSNKIQKQSLPKMEKTKLGFEILRIIAETSS